MVAEHEDMKILHISITYTVIPGADLDFNPTPTGEIEQSAAGRDDMCNEGGERPGAGLFAIKTLTWRV